MIANYNDKTKLKINKWIKLRKPQIRHRHDLIKFSKKVWYKLTNEINIFIKNPQLITLKKFKRANNNFFSNALSADKKIKYIKREKSYYMKY